MDNESLLKANSWKRFSNNKIWLEMVAELQQRIKECDLIINTIGADREVEFTKRDVSILKKLAYEELISIPDRNIADLTSGTEAGVEDFDPYSLDPVK